MTINKSTLIIVVGFILSLLIYVTITSYVNKKLKRDNKEIELLYKTDSAKLVLYKNKYNEEVSKTEILNASNNDLFTKLQFADANTRKLQNIVNKYEKENKELSTALYFANSTISHLKDSIQNLVIGWEVDVDTTKKYPIYQRSFSITDCFTTGSVTLGLHKFEIDIKTDNQYEVAIGEEKSGWFKKKQFAEITNKNKCTTTSVMKVYDKVEKPTKKGRAFLFGVGTTTGIIILLKILLL